MLNHHAFFQEISGKCAEEWENIGVPGGMKPRGAKAANAKQPLTTFVARMQRNFAHRKTLHKAAWCVAANCVS